MNIDQNERNGIELRSLIDGNRQDVPFNPAKKPIILYEEELPPEYASEILPNELALKRNSAIKALIVQAFAAVTGYGFFFFRKVNSHQ